MVRYREVGRTRAGALMLVTNYTLWPHQTNPEELTGWNAP